MTRNYSLHLDPRPHTHQPYITAFLLTGLPDPWHAGAVELLVILVCRRCPDAFLEICAVVPGQPGRWVTHVGQWWATGHYEEVAMQEAGWVAT